MKDMDEWLGRELPGLMDIRRDIHAHPEMGFEEVRTSRLVADKLRSWGIDVTENVGNTGVVGTIRGSRPGHKSIGLRADMDALAIHEATGLPYASQHAGCMHACGHDGHTTMLLGAARYLAEHPDFGGTLHLIFQPAEEGRRGARAMVQDGLFDRFPCDAIYGLHNTPGMPIGAFGTRVGPLMAAADNYTVVFRGVGGHGGVSPHLSTDITYAQAHFILGLQGIVGRNIAPREVAAISVGYVSGGSIDAPNVIPTELTIRGTARCYSEDTRALIERRIAELASATAATWGCTVESVYERGPAAVINREEQVEVAVTAAVSVAGASNVDQAFPITTGGEDFADMMQVRPGAFIRAGNGFGKNGLSGGLHTPTYDFDDDAIPHGIRYWVAVTHEELGGLTA